MHMLGCQTDMRANRNAARGNKGDRFGHGRATFKFDNLGAGFHQSCGGAKSLLRAFLAFPAVLAACASRARGLKLPERAAANAFA